MMGINFTTKNYLKKTLVFFIVLFTFVMLFSPIATSLSIQQTSSGEFHSFISMQPSVAHAQNNVEGLMPVGTGSGEAEAAHGGVIRWIGGMILSMGAAVTRAGGLVFEGVLERLVIDMTDWAPDHTINSIWAMIRDICNLAFIFGFIYLGISTIFDPESARTKRFLTKIIIGALLINFSLLFSQIIVDLGNYTAITIYNTGIASFSDSKTTLAAAFINVIGLSSMWGSLPADTMANLPTRALWTFYVLGFVFLFTAGFVFLLAGIMLIVRFITLILIMVFSPILFAATIFPQTERYASEMWSKLISSSVYPAIFLFLVFLSLRVIQEFKQSLDLNFVESLKSSDSNGFIDVTLMFLVAMFLLVQSLLIAKRLSIGGSDFAVNSLNTLRKTAQGYVGRGAIRAGFGAARLSATTGLVAGNLATGRGRKSFSEAWSGTSKMNLKGLSESQENMRTSNSYLKRSIAATMRGTGIEAGIQTVNKANFDSSESIADVDKKDKEVANARYQTDQVFDTESKINAVNKAGASATSDDRIEMERAIANSSTEQLQKIHDSLEGTPAFAQFAGNLSSSQYEALMKAKPEDLNDHQKDVLRKAREVAVNDRLIDAETIKRLATPLPPGAAPLPPATITDVIGKASGADLDALNFKTVEDNANMLSVKQIDEMKNLTTTQKATLKQRRKATLIAEAAAGNHAEIFKRFKSPTEASKLPGEILTDSASAQYLTPEILTKALDNDDLEGISPSGQSFKAIVKDNVMAALTPTQVDKRRALERFFRTPAGNNYA